LQHKQYKSNNLAKYLLVILWK